jgi:hypothetical protein
MLARAAVDKSLIKIKLLQKKALIRNGERFFCVNNFRNNNLKKGWSFLIQIINNSKLKGVVLLHIYAIGLK